MKRGCNARAADRSPLAPHSPARVSMSSTVDAPSAPDDFDPYATLECDRTADEAEIKRNYRRLALKHHPDKRDGDDAEFKRVALAYKILSDPESRQAYDRGGCEAVHAPDVMDAEIDFSEAGFGSTLMASMISSLGVNIKTAVPVKVLESVRRGVVAISRAEVGCKVSESVRKGEIRLFRCEITAENARAGVVVSVTSPAGDKFKLLKFDKGRGGDAGDGLELSLQEVSARFDSVKPKRSHAGFYFTGTQTFNYEPINAVKLAKLESRDLAVFRSLDNWTPRECVSIEPGEHVFGVYGDNFFDKCKFEFEIFALGTDCGNGRVLDSNEIRDIESKLSNKKHELMKFEKEYLVAKAAFEKAVVKHHNETEEVKALIAAREAAYCALTLPLAATEVEDSAGASNGFVMPTIDTSAFVKNFSFSNPFAKK